MHTWLSNLLPDIPASRLLGDVDTTTSITQYLTYINTFVGSMLRIEYTGKTATFYSSSPSTIGIIKDHLSREATARNMLMNMNVELHPQAALHLLTLLQNKLQHGFTLNRQVALIPALQE